MFRILKYAVKNIIRSTFLSFSSVFTIGLIVFFIFVLFFVQYATDHIISSVNDRISISLNLRTGYTDTNTEVIELLALLKSIDSVSVKYISSKDAFSVMKSRDPDLARVVEGDSENPLPASILIENIPLSHYDDVDSAVRRYSSVVVYDTNSSHTLVDYKAQYGRIHSLLGILTAIRSGIYIVVLCFLMSVALIVYTIIGNFVFFFREEIRIVSLVGGDGRFLYGPFVIQGVFYTAGAWLFALVAFVSFLRSIDFSVIMDFSTFSDTFLSQYTTMFGLILLAVVFTGGMSGYMSARRFVAASAQ